MTSYSKEEVWYHYQYIHSRHTQALTHPLIHYVDYMALREMNIKNNSVLTLHALGMSAELKQKMMKEAMKKKAAAQALEMSNIVMKEEMRKRTLNTKITAAMANHSYNGIIFDVQCNGPYELNLMSISIGGMLGRVRIFARDRPWEQDKPTQRLVD